MNKPLGKEGWEALVLTKEAKHRANRERRRLNEMVNQRHRRFQGMMITATEQKYGIPFSEDVDPSDEESERTWLAACENLKPLQKKLSKHLFDERQAARAIRKQCLVCIETMTQEELHESNVQDPLHPFYLYNLSMNSARERVHMVVDIVTTA